MRGGHGIAGAQQPSDPVRVVGPLLPRKERPEVGRWEVNLVVDVRVRRLVDLRVRVLRVDTARVLRDACVDLPRVLV